MVLGTTARAAWCGVPSLIVPVLHWSDQPLWGRQLEALKAGAIVLDPTEQNISESLLEITRFAIFFEPKMKSGIDF